MYIINPKTGRKVLKNGKIGKKILKNQKGSGDPEVKKKKGQKKKKKSPVKKKKSLKSKQTRCPNGTRKNCSKWNC